MSATFGWGIVGTGFVARVFAEGLADAPGAQLAAVASRDAARARAFCARYGAARAHGSYEALARDPEVRIVYVATPNSDHLPTALMMLEAGKAVVCEKPFALNGGQAREIVAAARARRLFCMEAMWMRFMPAVVDFVGHVNAGAIGEPRSATIELGHAFVADAAHRLFDPALGGGALLDLGVYAVSLAVLLFGPPLSVQSHMTPGPTGADEHVSALLAHTGGRQSVIATSLRTRLSNGASVAGTTGWARLHEPLYRPPAFTTIPAPAQAVANTPIEPPRGAPPGGAAPWRARAVRAVASRMPTLFRRSQGRTVRRPYVGNGYGYQATEAMRCVGAGLLESPVMPLDETLRVMDALDAIRARWKVL